MGNTEYILQALLDQTKDSNTVLNSIRDSLIEQARGNGSGSGAGDRRRRNDNNRNNDRRQGSFFKSLSGTIKNELGAIGKFGLGNAGGSPIAVTNQLGTTVSNITGALSKIPGPVGAAAGAFQLVVDAGMMLYNYMNEQLDMYNRMSSAGVDLEKGTMSLKRGAQLAMLTVDEFNTVLLDNTVAVAKLNDKYGNGVEAFGSLIQSISQAQNDVGLYGLSQKQLGDITLKYIKTQNMLGSTAHIRDMNQAASTKDFISALTNMSKTMGQSVDYIMTTMQNMSKSTSSLMMPAALMQRFGIDKQKATDAVTGMNLFLSSIPNGQMMMDGLNDYLVLGSEINDKQTAMVGVYGRWQRDMLNVMKMGLSPKETEIEVRKLLASYQKNGMADEIANALIIAKSAGEEGSLLIGTALQHAILEATTSLKNDDKPKDAMATLANRWNLWVNKEITTPFSNLMDDMGNGVAKWLLRIADYDHSNFFSDLADDFMSGYHTLNNGLNKGIDYLIEASGKSIDELWDDTTNTIKGWYTDVSDYFFGRSYEINDDGTLSPKALFGDDISRLFTSLKDKVSSWVTDFTDWIGLTEPEKPKEPIIPFDELPQEDVSRMMGSYKTQLQGHELEEYRQMNEQYRNQQLNREAASTKPKPLQVNTDSSTKPEKTPVQKIEIPKKETINTDAIDNTMKMQQEQREIDNLNLTKNMLATMQNQADQYQVMMNYLREIAENTIPEAST